MDIGNLGQGITERRDSKKQTTELMDDHRHQSS